MRIRIFFAAFFVVASPTVGAFAKNPPASVTPARAASSPPTYSCGSSEVFSEIKKKCVATSSAPCDPGEEVKTDSGGVYCTKKSSSSSGQSDKKKAEQEFRDNVEKLIEAFQKKVVELNEKR